LSLSKESFSKKFRRVFGIVKWIFTICILITLIPSCGDEKKTEQEPSFSLSDSLAVNTEAKKLLGNSLKFLLTGNFDMDSLQEVAAGIELTENNNWGIKFLMLKIENNQLIKKYETDLLQGSFKESHVTKIKLSANNYDHIYYNSQDYFWGSGGGEVFSYIIDLGGHNTFYAHLFSESRRPIELFLSENITDQEIRNYFISTFRKDYPDLRLAAEDVSLDF